MKYLKVIIFILTLNIAFKIFSYREFLSINEIEEKLLNKLILIIISVVCVSVFFKLKKHFFFNKHFVYLVLGIILLYFSYDLLSNNLIKTVEQILFFTSCLFTGIFEELFFRVFIFLVLLEITIKRSIKKNIYYSSLIFGLAHLSNLFTDSIIVPSVIIQVFFAFIMGYFLSALLIKTKNIIVPITIHTLINYFGGFNSYFNQRNVVSDYELSSFISSLIFVVLIGIILIPISNYFINSEIKTWSSITYKQ